MCDETLDYRRDGIKILLGCPEGFSLRFSVSQQIVLPSIRWEQSSEMLFPLPLSPCLENAFLFLLIPALTALRRLHHAPRGHGDGSASAGGGFHDVAGTDGARGYGTGSASSALLLHALYVRSSQHTVDDLCFAHCKIPSCSHALMPIYPPNFRV